MEPILKPPNVTRCKSCGAQIFFARSGGKYKPLDAMPVAYIDPTEELPRTETLFTMGGVAFPAVTGDDIPDYVDKFYWGYRNHFATCPTAREHRKTRANSPSSGPAGHLPPRGKASPSSAPAGAYSPRGEGETGRQETIWGRDRW